MNKCFIGDCREVMRDLITQGVKVQMCVTSPPYWGLRDYGTATWEGGDSNCNHIKTPLCSNKSGLEGYTGENIKLRTYGMPYKDVCGKCGAIRIDRQLGLEKTPEEYVANLVEVFRLVRELLADDGSLWLNLGDSFAGSGCGTNDYRTEASRSINKSDIMYIKKPPQQRCKHFGLKPKDLVGIPWAVAFALRADGWYLRSDIIWHKTDPMPESVKDRPTKSHEYIFLLTKNAKYYYDYEAIMEESIDPESYIGRRKRNAPTMAKYDLKNLKNAGSILPDGTLKSGMTYEKRNKRSVWTVNTQPYKEAHFATFPPKLIEPCILAGSRLGDTVFDPFFGSGTTGQVAENLGRKWIGIELNEKYKPLWQERTRQIGLFI